MSIAKTKRFTVLALLAAIAITLNILETTMIPPLMGVFRIGLANIMALVALRMLGIKEMLIVNAMRVLIGNLLTGTIFGSVFWKMCIRDSITRIKLLNGSSEKLNSTSKE